MSRSTKSSWLEGKGDLREADVEDVPIKGQSVRVRGLPAAYSNQAQSEALEMKTIGDTQIATINVERVEVLQFAHGVIEPEFSVEEAEEIAKKFGPAFKKVVAKIDELSGVDKDSMDKAEARFPAGGSEPGGAREARDDAPTSGNGGSVVPARAGT